MPISATLHLHICFSVCLQDGYRVAKPSFIHDDSLSADSEAAQAIALECAEVEAIADAWVARLSGLAVSRRGIAELLHRAGDKPKCGCKEKLSFWVVSVGPAAALATADRTSGAFLHSAHGTSCRY